MVQGEADNREVEKIRDALSIKKYIGYLSGNTKLYGRLTVRELMEMFAGIYGIPENEIPDRIDKVIDLLDLSEFIDNRIEKLSTGQIQRASISRCRLLFTGLIQLPYIFISNKMINGITTVLYYVRNRRRMPPLVILS